MQPNWALGEERQDLTYLLTYSFEGDVGIVEKNGLVPAHSSSSEPHISLLLQQAQHLLGHITGIGCSKLFQLPARARRWLPLSSRLATPGQCDLVSLTIM